MSRIHQFVAVLFVIAAPPLILSAGCGSRGEAFGVRTGEITPNDTSGASGDDSGGSSGTGSSGSSTTGASPTEMFTVTPPTSNCSANSGLDCYVNTKCKTGSPTTLTGKVYDPAGRVPLYNVVVWVPLDENSLPSLTTGTSSCNRCDTAVSNYVTATTTAADGSFTLQGIPTMANMPLVIQIGKWRRVIHVARIADCATTTLPSSDPGQARLPRNQQEGDMPQMALLTGGEDNLGCFLMRMGVDPAEYGPPHSQGGKGRLDIYQGLAVLPLPGPGPGLSSGTAGNCTNTSCPLWQTKSALENYDIVLLACEGSTFDANPVPVGADGGGANLTLAGNRSNVNTQAKQNMHDWLDEGGKVFATHFHYTWFQSGPADFQGVANWKGFSVGSGTCTNCSVDVSFPKGAALSSWLQTAGGLSGNGITLNYVADSVSTVNSPTFRWIYGQSGATTGPMDTKYLSFETPIGGLPVPDAGTETTRSYCGKAVFSDLHAGGMPAGAVPAACQMSDLSPQEKALEFLFFDLSACVQDDRTPPYVPPPPK